MFKRLVLAMALMVSASGIQASTINEPGYTEVLLANVLPSDNSFGSMAQAVDGSGNIYVAAGWGDEVYKVTPGGVVTQFGTTGGSISLGAVIIGDTLFIGFDSGQIRTMDLTQAAPNGVLLATLSNAAMGMVVAPSGFGAYGGQLVVGTYDGISIVHPTTGAVTVLLSTPGNPHSDLGFTPGGQLLATDYDSSRIVSVSDTGTESVFYAGPSFPDGLAIHPGTGEVYVATSTQNAIIKIAADGSVASEFASTINFDGGWYISPIRFSNDAMTLYYGADSPAFNLYAISGFTAVGPVEAAVPVPTLSAWALIVLTMMFSLVIVAGRKRLFG